MKITDNFKMNNNPNVNDFIAEQNKAFIDSLREKKNNVKDVDMTKKKELLAKVAMGDVKAKAQVLKGLVENVTISIPAQTMFGQFFEQGTFEAGKEGWFYRIKEQYNEGSELNVYQIRRNGSAPAMEVLNGETRVFVRPYQITSDEFSMDKFNLELGMIEEPQIIQQLAARNIAWKLETDAETLLGNGLYGEGHTDESINSIVGINISNRISGIPTSNDMDLSAYDGLTLDTLKDIAKYALKMGREIESIYAPVGTSLEMWDWLDVPEQFADQDPNAPLPSKLVPELIRNKIVQEGVPGQLFGRNFNIQSVNTLNDDATAADVYMWIKFKGSSGHLKYFTGNEFADSYTHEDANKIYYNLKKTLMLFQTPSQRTNYLRVKVKAKAKE